MTRARDIANLVDSNGDVVAGALDNVPPADLVNDTSPQLGGNLDLNSSNITGTGDINIAGSVTATGLSVDSSGTINFSANDGPSSSHQFAYNEGGGEMRLIDSSGSNTRTLIDYGTSFGSRFLNSDTSGDCQIGQTATNTSGEIKFMGAGYVERMTIGSGGQVSIGGDPITQSGLSVNTQSISVKGSDGDWNQGGNRAFMDIANGYARVGSANGGGNAMGLDLYAGGYNAIGIHSKGYAEIAKNSNSSGTGSWHVVREGDTVKCHKAFNAGASAANYNLFGMRRHYWGGGHYRINIRRSYYNDSSETIYFVDGNNRPGYSLTFPRHNENGDLGNGRVYEVSRTSSYPGDGSVSNYSIIGLNVPSYYQYEVILEFNAHNAVWCFDDSEINTHGNSWRLL